MTKENVKEYLISNEHADQKSSESHWKNDQQTLRENHDKDLKSYCASKKKKYKKESI